MTTMTATTPGLTGALRRLYVVRFGFAVVWAGLLATTRTELGVLAAILLVLYPLFDVAAAFVDISSSRSRELIVNIAVSALAVIGLGIAVASGIPAVLRVWVAWAVLAGLVQLFVGLRRRALGGQIPMILSGGISVLAGSGFIRMASQDHPSLINLAGYALLGGIFFLISAIRLGRSAAGRP